MKFKKILFFIPFATTILFSNQTGEELFNKNCSECHATILGVDHDGGYENKLLTPAPYVSDLVKKLKEETGTQEKFAEFINAYIENPDKRKTLYGKRAIKKFGLMPSLKGVMSEDEKSLLIDYLYHEKYNPKEPEKIEKKEKIEEVDPRKKLFDKNCASCHATILGVTHDGGYDNSFISPAPYVDDLVKKLKEETGTQEKFTVFIQEYIENPDKRKSLYGKKAIKKFGIMPSLKGALTQEEITQLSNYLYEKHGN